MPRPGRVIVHGRSMVPTYADGDVLLVLWGVPVPLWRVAVVRLPDRPLAVKRVRRHGVTGRWWVEGDAPDASTDSRTLGWLPPDAVCGLVVGRLYRLPPGPGGASGQAARDR
jgi:hypothetical protein